MTNNKEKYHACDTRYIKISRNSFYLFNNIVAVPTYLMIFNGIWGENVEKFCYCIRTYKYTST